MSTPKKKPIVGNIPIYFEGHTVAGAGTIEFLARHRLLEIGIPDVDAAMLSKCAGVLRRGNLLIMHTQALSGTKRRLTVLEYETK